MNHSARTTPNDVDPIAQATAWIDAALPAPPATVAFIGAGHGHVLDVLERRAPATRALVLEPDPGTAQALLARRDWNAWLASGRLVVLQGPEYAGGTRTARDFRDLHHAPVLVHPDLARERPADVERARQALSRLTFEASANENARRASAGRYLLHTLTNLPRLARESDVRALSGLAAGRPAVIAAAGPSLDRNVHDLVAVRDRAIVITCDTAARPLSVPGIDPDFIVAADSSRTNAAHVATLPPGRGWLVAEGSLHSSAFTNFDRRTFVFRVANHHPWPWLASLGLQRGLLDTWGSVATSAFSLAVLLGCDPIVFIGADFAFTGGRPYCRGTSFEPQWAAWNAGGASYESIWELLVGRWPAVTAADIHGKPARTAQHLVAFRSWLVERAASHQGRIINATGAGLLAGQGIEQRPLAAALAGVAALDFDALHKVFRAAHGSTRGDAVQVMRGVDAVLGTAGASDREAWSAFASGAVNDAIIDHTLRSPEYAMWALASADPSAAQEAR